MKGTVGQGASIHVVTEQGTVTVRKAGAEDIDQPEKPEKPEAQEKPEKTET